MKQKTRDNLIYLAVGLGVAALVVADVVYSESHGQEMWWPSRFMLRLVFGTGLLVYFIVRETVEMKLTLVQILACVLLGTIVNLVIFLGFRQAVDQLPGLTFAPLAVLELFLVMQLVLQLGKRFKVR